VLPFLVLEPEDNLPQTEKEAISKRLSLTQLQEPSGGSIRRNLVRNANSESYIFSTIDRPQAGTRHGQLTKGMSLAQMKVTSSRDKKGREALLQLEIDSLRNQNRELQKQLHGLKLLMQEEAAEE
jgi:hypothetical protein